MALYLLFVLVLLGAGWLCLPLLHSIYVRLLAVGGEIYYSFEGKNLDFSVRGAEIFFKSRTRPRFEANLSPEAIYSNMVILMALILPAPGMRLKKRAAVVAAAIGLLYLSHVAFLVTKVEVTLVTVDHPISWRCLALENLGQCVRDRREGLFPDFHLAGLDLPLHDGAGGPDAEDRRGPPSG